MRTIQEISDLLKVSFVANETLQVMYELQPGKTYDEQFSKVCIESVLIFIFASASWLLEQLWNTFQKQIEKRINESYVASPEWYYSKALAFQKGDTLVFDANTYSFNYPTIDPAKQVVKNVAIRQVTDEGVTKLKIYFSDERKQPVTGDLRESFESYLRRIGSAGIHYLLVSEAPDPIRVHLNIYYDPLVLDSAGSRLSGEGKPVEETIEKYLNSLEYGGVFYGSKLVDMIQETEGVNDVVLEATTWNGTKENRRKIDAASGAFVFDKQTGDIIYSID